MTDTSLTQFVPLGTRERARPALRVGTIPVLVVLLVAGLVTLQLWARATDYPLRVTSDTPTFLALIPELADRPFERQSPYLDDPDLATTHAEPYTQALAFLWRAVAPAGAEADPIALSRLLALVGIGVMLLVLATVFLYARATAGRGAAWVAVPVLLALFGPANVIWASDLSLHGFLYAGWFPQNVAIALLLLTLLALERDGRSATVAATLLAALTMTVHPFTGVLLTLLATVRAWQLSCAHDRRWRRVSLALAGGFLLGSLWPAYSLSAAMAEVGLPGWLFVSLAAASPLLLWRRSAGAALRGTAGRLEAFAARLADPAWASWLALAGLATVLLLSLWVARLAHLPPDDPLITTNRLSTYWVEDRWRWPLLLAAGAIGLHGLARMALRGTVVPAAWFAGCFAVGTTGAVASLFGLQIPIWYRFLLAAQIPLAIGVAAAVSSAAPRAVRIVAITVGFSLAFKVLALVALPPTHTYFRTPIQEVWSLGTVIPPGDGLVATDPRTAYFIPGVTGRRVLTVTKAHVGSAAELAAADRGYTLLHRYWSGGTDWWDAGREMWRQGVRWVVIEKSTLLSAPTLEEFSTGPVPLVHPGPEREQLGNYYYENNRVGSLVYDGSSYAVYRLDHRRLFAEDHREPRRSW